MPAIWTAPRTWTTGEVVTAGMLNTHLRDNLEFLKLREDTPLNLFTILNGFSFTTTSTTFVDVNAAFVGSLATSGAPLMIGASGSWKNSSAGADCCLDVNLNGSRIGNTTYGLTLMQAPAANAFQPFAFTQVRNLAAGTHTLRLQWRVSGGTLEIGGVNFTSFFAVELI